MGEKVKISLIATYPKISDIFLELTRGKANIEAKSIYASFGQAVEIAKEMEQKGEVDVILSRGGTADQIKNAVDTPVVFIPITPFDVIRIVHKLPETVKKAALIHYKKHVPGVQEIAAMYGLTIIEYSFISHREVETAIKDAHKKGISVIIGGEVAVRIAAGLGIKGYQISAGREAVVHAIEESLTLFAEKRKEQNKAVQTKTAYDSLKEGIVVTDENRKIVMLNQAAEALFARKYKAGDVAGREIINEKCLQVYHTRRETPVYVQKIQKSSYAILHMPIIKDEKFIGVVTRIENVTHLQEQEQKVRKELHQKGFAAKYHFRDIITQDPGMKRLLRLADIYAKTDSAILVEGESGTGKELLAQSIHNASSRAGGPFVAVNCAAIPENLLESELFGYEVGAFTGARKEGKAGLFELAHHGTLFLDEIGEISKSVQTRLLRVLQEKEIMRIGGNRIIPVNVRIISATNKDLKIMVKDNNFRIDLYYRLNVLQLTLPPLRKRGGDVRLLAENFLNRYSLGEDRREAVFSMLDAYSWPGNIRELQNVMERFGALEEVMGEELAEDAYLSEVLGISVFENTGDTLQVEVELGRELGEMVEQTEYKIVSYYMEKYNNNQDLVAKALGIGRTTLWRKYRRNKMEL